jgi:hypothetical protein
MRVLFSLTTKLSKRKNHDLGSEPTPLIHQLLPANGPPSRLLCLLLQLMHPHTNKSTSLSLSLMFFISTYFVSMGFALFFLS